MSPVGHIASYCAVAGLVCCFVASIELLHRYSHASRPGAILLNWPALLYISINVLVGALAALGGYASGIIVFDMESTYPTIANVFRSIGAGLGGLGLLRSSLATFQGERG